MRLYKHKNTPSFFKKTNPSENSVVMEQSGDCIVIQERAGRFSPEIFSESALRLVGVLFVLIGMLQWFLPQFFFGMLEHHRWIFLLAFVGTGIGLYFFAHRGFRKELVLNFETKTITVARINSRGNSLIRRCFPMDRVDSVFVQRRLERSMAVLNLRLKGNAQPYSSLTGSAADLQRIHSLLCWELGTGVVHRPRRVHREAPIICQRKPLWPGRIERMSSGWNACR